MVLSHSSPRKPIIDLCTGKWGVAVKNSKNLWRCNWCGEVLISPACQWEWISCNIPRKSFSKTQMRGCNIAKKTQKKKQNKKTCFLWNQIPEFQKFHFFQSNQGRIPISPLEGLKSETLSRICFPCLHSLIQY